MHFNMQFGSYLNEFFHLNPIYLTSEIFVMENRNGKKNYFGIVMEYRLTCCAFFSLKNFFTFADSDPPDLQFMPMGHLFLAQNDERAKRMENDNKTQLSLNAKIKLMNRDELQLKFPFMNFDDVVLGSYGKFSHTNNVMIKYEAILNRISTEI